MWIKRAAQSKMSEHHRNLPFSPGVWPHLAAERCLTAGLLRAVLVAAICGLGCVSCRPANPSGAAAGTGQSVPGKAAARPAHAGAQAGQPAAPGSVTKKPEALSLAQQAKLKTAEAVLASPGSTAAEREAALLELMNTNNPALLDVVRKALRDPSADVREAALQLLTDVDNADVPALATQGLKDAESMVRLAAVRALHSTDGPGVAEALGLAIQDAESEVRSAAFDELDGKSEDTQVTTLTAAIQLPNTETVSDAVEFLQQMRSHPAVEILIDGLDDARPEVRDMVADALEILIGERFASRAAAQAFWAKNQERYDTDLRELDDRPSTT